MRTAQRDQTGLITFTGTIDGGQPTGSGSANGVAYTWTRTATGDYTLRWDPALVAVSTVLTGVAGFAAPITPGVGQVRIQAFNTAGALTNQVVYFSITGRRVAP